MFLLAGVTKCLDIASQTMNIELLERDFILNLLYYTMKFSVAALTMQQGHLNTTLTKGSKLRIRKNKK